MLAGLAAIAVGGAPAASAATLQLGSTGGFAYASNVKVVTGNSGWKKTASCPGKRVAVGGGALVTGSATTGYLSSSYPSGPGHRSWTTRGYNASSGLISANTYAICAKPELGIHYASKEGKVGVGPAGGSAKATCKNGRPGSGGVRVFGPTQGASLRATAPFEGPDADPFEDGWRASVGSIAGPKRMFRVYAICSNEFGRVFTAQPMSAASSTFTDDVTCALGPVQVSGPTGAGVFIPGPDLGAHIHSFAPRDGADMDIKPDDHWGFSISNDAGPEKLVDETVYCRGV